MDKYIERALIGLMETQKQKLQNEMVELKRQIDETEK